MNQTPNNYFFNSFLTSLHHVTIFFHPFFQSASSPSNSLLTNVEEIEKAVYESQAHRSFSLQTITRVKRSKASSNLPLSMAKDNFFAKHLVMRCTLPSTYRKASTLPRLRVVKSDVQYTSMQLRK